MRTFITLTLLLIVCTAFSQDTLLTWRPRLRTSTIGLNTTPLLVQLLPFNRSDPQLAGPYFVTLRSYNSKDVAFRLGIGWNVSTGDGVSDVDDAHINLRLGWEKRKGIFKKWTYSGGFDFFLSAGDLNISSEKDNDTLLVGLGPTWGIDYFINEAISLSIETSLLIGYTPDLDGIQLEFIPPIALYLNFAVPKKKKK